MEINDIKILEHKDEYGLLLYYCSSSPKIYSDKILILDLDWTLIRPKSNKKYPIDKDDWCFNMDISKIHQYYQKGWKIIIMTNQKKYNPLHMIPKLTNIINQLNGFEIYGVDIFIATKDDYYRKPSTAIWNFFEKNLNNDYPINYRLSLMIGDAAGRKNDFSAVDIMLAENIGISFMTPEIFASYNHDNIFNNRTITITDEMQKLITNLENNDKYFNPFTFYSNQQQDENLYIEYQKTIKNITQILKDLINNDKQFLIILIGPPASTKSTFSNQIINNLNTILNQKNQKINNLSYDQFDGSKILFKKEFNKALINNQNIINQNTNRTIQERIKWTSIAKNHNYYIISVNFNYPKSLIIHLNNIRNKDISINETLKKPNIHKQIPEVAIHTYFKNFEHINPNKENIDKSFQIKYLDLQNSDFRTKFLQY